MANFRHYGKPKNISNSELLSSAQINDSGIMAEANTSTGSDAEMNVETNFNDHICACIFIFCVSSVFFLFFFNKNLY